MREPDEFREPDCSVGSLQIKEHWEDAQFDREMKVWMIPMESFDVDDLMSFGVSVTKIERDGEE